MKTSFSYLMYHLQCLWNVFQTLIHVCFVKKNTCILTGLKNDLLNIFHVANLKKIALRIIWMPEASTYGILNKFTNVTP